MFYGIIQKIKVARFLLKHGVVRFWSDSGSPGQGPP